MRRLYFSSLFLTAVACSESQTRVDSTNPDDPQGESSQSTSDAGETPRSAGETADDQVPGDADASSSAISSTHPDGGSEAEPREDTETSTPDGEVGGGAGGALNDPASEACPGDGQLCGGTCVDTSNNPAHCGDCNVACGVDAECEQGECLPLCQTQLDCEVGQACAGESCDDLADGRSFQQDESRDSEYGTRPQIDVSSTGHAAVVWNATMNDELRVSRYLLGESTWTPPLVFHEPMAPFVSSPDVAVDDAGNVIAVWHQGGNEYRDGWANRYDANSGTWGTPQLIEPDGNGFADELRVVMDGAGNATAVWPFSTGQSGWMQVTRYEAASGTWGRVVDLSPEVDSGASNTALATDAYGNVMVAWTQRLPDEEYNDTLAAVYDMATDSWGPMVSIDGHDLGHTNHPNISADGAGNFFVAWHQSGEDVSHVWVNRYEAANHSWGSAHKLDSASGDRGAIYGKVGADEHGNCLVIWEEDSLLMSAHYDAASGEWSTLGEVDPNDDAIDPRLVVDRGGNGIALWRGSGGRVYISRFDAQLRTWSEREAIDPVHADRTSAPDIDIDAEGRGFATWHEIGASGSWEVMTNRFE